MKHFTWWPARLERDGGPTAATFRSRVSGGSHRFLIWRLVAFYHAGARGGGRGPDGCAAQAGAGGGKPRGGHRRRRPGGAVDGDRERLRGDRPGCHAARLRRDPAVPAVAGGGNL